MRPAVFLVAMAVCLAGSSPSAAGSRPSAGSSLRGRTAVSRATSGKSRRHWKRPFVNRRRAARVLRPRRIQPAALAQNLRRGDILVLDLDNTVVDTRPRTLEAARRFARSNRDLPGEVRERIERASVADVGYDSAETARRLGIPEAQRAAFDELWSQVFWNAESLELDQPIDSTIEMAREAARRGIEVRYLTGRAEHFREATLRQIERIGLPLSSPEHVALKPKRTLDTARFKRDQLRALSRRGRIVFVDDSPRNIAALRRVRGVRPVQVEFPVREPGWTPPALGAQRLDLGSTVAR